MAAANQLHCTCVRLIVPSAYKKSEGMQLTINPTCEQKQTGNTNTMYCTFPPPGPPLVFARKLLHAVSSK